jgi:hypothetical protein
LTGLYREPQAFGGGFNHGLNWRSGHFNPLIVSTRRIHLNLLFLAATQPKKETSPAADEKNDWKCRRSKFPKVCTSKYQWSKQRECDCAYDSEQKRKQYSFAHS